MTEKPSVRESRLTDVEHALIENIGGFVEVAQRVKEMLRTLPGYHETYELLQVTGERLESLKRERDERAEPERLQRRVRSLEVLCEARQQELDAKTDEAQKLRVEVVERREDEAKWQEEVVFLKDRSQDLEHLCNARQEQIDELHAKLDELGKQVATFRASLEAAHCVAGPVVPERKAW